MIFTKFLEGTEGKKYSGYLVFGNAPNHNGVPNLSKTYCRRIVIMSDISIETTSKKLIPLQLLRLERSSFLKYF